MRSAIATAALALAAAVFLAATAPSAWALDLSDAKTAGLVGERPDGYIGAVGPDPTPETQQLVANINTKRKLEYSRIAKESGTTVEAVAALAGAKLIERTPPGQYVLGVDVRWTKK
jgi:uncharacterized protein YdbL (DUF1318 family)